MSKPAKTFKSKIWPHWIPAFFKAEREKFSIISGASFIIGLILYANEAVEYKSVSIESNEPFVFVQVIDADDGNAIKRMSFDPARLTFINKFGRGVMINNMAFVVRRTRSNYTPRPDCFISDEVERKLDPEYAIYPLIRTESVGLTEVPGGFIIPGRAAKDEDIAVATVSIRPERGDAAASFIPFIEALSSEGYKDGTAWGCLTIDLKPRNEARRVETRLLGVYQKPMQTGSLNAGLGGIETFYYGLPGDYSSRGVEFYRVRKFNLLGPLKNLR